MRIKCKLHLVIMIMAIMAVKLYSQSPIATRINSRNFPSVFQAWNKADNLSGEKAINTIARHDLMWHVPEVFKMKWNNTYVGLADSITPQSIVSANIYRDSILKLNPNMILLGEIRYRDADSKYLPTDSKWWMRDSQGNLVYGWEEGGYIRLELRDTTFQNNVAQKAAAAVKSGVLDGVFLDWWDESEYTNERISLLKKIRKAIGPDALIIVNSNQLKVPLSAPYVNGLFMECYDSPYSNASDWDTYRTTLEWAESNLLAPRVNCLETWWNTSRNDLNRMRATTTLVLTRSDGYALFSDPNTLPAPDHLHSWYSFYDESLGRPLSAGLKRTDKAWQREFTNGFAVYNPLGNSSVNVVFNSTYRSAATGNVGTTFSVPAFDGDIFIKTPTNDLEDLKTNESELYPNPFDSFINVGSNALIEKITFISSTGRVVAIVEGNKSNQNRINTSSFPTGFYLIKIETPEGVTVKKGIKINQ